MTPFNCAIPTGVNIMETKKTKRTRKLNTTTIKTTNVSSENWLNKTLKNFRDVNQVEETRRKNQKLG